MKSCENCQFQCQKDSSVFYPVKAGYLQANIQNIYYLLNTGQVEKATERAEKIANIDWDLRPCPGYQEIGYDPYTSWKEKECERLGIDVP